MNATVFSKERSMEITDGDDVAKSVIRGWLIGVEALLQGSEDG